MNISNHTSLKFLLLEPTMKLLYHILRVYVLLYSWFHFRQTRRFYGNRGHPVWSVTTEMPCGQKLSAFVRYLEQGIYGQTLEGTWANNWVSVPKLWWIRKRMREAQTERFKAIK